MKTYHLIFSLLLLSFVTSCKKDETPITAADIYAMGNTNTMSPQQIYYYKNGVKTLVTDGTESSSGRDIFIENDDVYIAGSVYVYPDTGSSYYQTCYWKNGIKTDLIYPTYYYEYAEATSIQVVNGDVYVLGAVAENFSTNRQLVFWKNGAINYLSYSDVSSFSRSFSIYNNDFYACGAVTLAGVNTACYWKNGVRTMLSSSLSAAESIIVNDDGIHITYAEYGGGAIATSLKYWKDGTETILYTGSGVLGKMTIKNNQVYIAGASFEGTLWKACYWKNGVKKDLADGNTLICRAVAEANNGQVIAFASSSSELFPTLWIDDESSAIGGGAGEHTSAFTIYNPK